MWSSILIRPSWDVALNEQLGRPEMFPKVQNDNVNVVFQYVVIIETTMFLKITKSSLKDINGINVLLWSLVPKQKWVWTGVVVGILTNEDKDLVVRISEEHGDGERLKGTRQQSKPAAKGTSGQCPIKGSSFNHQQSVRTNMTMMTNAAR